MNISLGGLLGLIGVVVLFLITKRFFPSLSTVLLVIGGIALACIAALVVLVVFFAFRKPQKPAAEKDAEDAVSVLAKGRSHLLELRQPALRVRDQEIRTSSERVCQVIQKILDTLKEQPEDIPKARQLFSYYLPTLGGILRRFLRLEQSGVPAVDTTDKVNSCLNSIQAAMEKLYASLFDNDQLDLTVEMEVLKQMCRQNGLLAENAVQTQDEEQNIALTL